VTFWLGRKNWYAPRMTPFAFVFVQFWTNFGSRNVLPSETRTNAYFTPAAFAFAQSIVPW
jgi:hypothetical protein